MLEKWNLFFQKIDWNILSGQLIVFGIIILSGYILSRLAKKIILIILMSIDKKTKKEAFQKNLKSFINPIGFFIVLLSLYVGLQLLSIPNEPYKVKEGLEKFTVILLLINLCWFLMGITSVGLFYFEKFAEKTDSKLDDQLIPILKRLAKILVLVIGLMLILTELGYSVTGLVAGLGIGGLALALAAKETLANIFGSLVIFTDKPFQIGDYIKTSKYEGTIEEVGFRSTQIRTLAQTLVYVPNNEISNAIIENITKMSKRFAQFKLNLSYSTSVSQIEALIKKIEDLLKNHPEVHQEVILVKFTEFSSSSLDVLVHFFIKQTVWAEFLKIKEEINLKIMQIMEEMHIEFAFPSTSIYIEKMPHQANR